MAPIERKSYTVTLPSLGKLNENFPNKEGLVELYPIRVFEEKILASGAGSPADRLNKLISSCLKTEIKVEDLLIVDRFFLMFQLAVMSYGNTREVNIKCPECGYGNNTVIDMAKDFPVTVIADDVEEPILLELPVSREKVRLRFLRVKDETAALALVNKLRSGAPKNKRKDTLSKDDIYSINLVTSIVSIDDKVYDLEERVEWHANLIGIDSRALKDAFNDYDFGVDTTFKVTCAGCQETFDSQLPSQEFFRL